MGALGRPWGRRGADRRWESKHTFVSSPPSFLLLLSSSDRDLRVENWAALDNYDIWALVVNTQIFNLVVFFKVSSLNVSLLKSDMLSLGEEPSAIVISLFLGGQMSLRLWSSGSTLSRRQLARRCMDNQVGLHSTDVVWSEFGAVFNARTGVELGMNFHITVQTGCKVAISP